MTILTAISNGANNGDIRETLNSVLSRLSTAENNVQSLTSRLTIAEGAIANLGTGGGNVIMPSVTLSADVVHNEGNSGVTSYLYTVTRSNSSGNILVPYTFIPGGTNSADFAGGVLPSSGTIPISDGQTTGSLTINVAGDSTVEPDEIFSIIISAPSGYVLGAKSSATGTVVNDDVAPPTTSNTRANSQTVRANNSAFSPSLASLQSRFATIGG